MKNIIQKPMIKVYRDNEYDMVSTWKPALKRTVSNTGTLVAQTVDRWFIDHKW